MKCRNCQASIATDDRFCGECGTKVERLTATEPVTATVLPESSPLTPPPIPPTRQPPEVTPAPHPARPAKQAPSGAVKLLIGLVVLLILGQGAVIGYLLLRDDRSETASRENNESNNVDRDRGVHDVDSNRGRSGETNWPEERAPAGGLSTDEGPIDSSLAEGREAPEESVSRNAESGSEIPEGEDRAAVDSTVGFAKSDDERGSESPEGENPLMASDPVEALAKRDDEPDRESPEGEDLRVASDPEPPPVDDPKEDPLRARLIGKWHLSPSIAKAHGVKLTIEFDRSGSWTIDAVELVEEDTKEDGIAEGTGERIVVADGRETRYGRWDIRSSDGTGFAISVTGGKDQATMWLQFDSKNTLLIEPMGLPWPKLRKALTSYYEIVEFERASP